MTLHSIDEQIREVENRIALERLALADAVDGCKRNLREAATSPKTLVALLGVGFAAGKMLFRDKPKGRKGRAQEDEAPVKSAGVLGLLTGIAGTALSMGTTRMGWGAVAKWAAGRYMRNRAAARAASKAAERAVDRRPPPPMRPAA